MTKIMYQPVKPFIINQRFSENLACIKNGDLQVMTCDGNNPPEGWRSLYGSKGHQGVDFATYKGQPVYCVQDGEVVSIDTDIKSGLDVRVKSKVKDIEFLHIYEHLQGYSAYKGQKLKAGQLIGWADNTGYSSGDHLHFETRYMDGTPFDPLPLMENIFAKNILALTDVIAYVSEQLALISDKIGELLRK